MVIYRLFDVDNTYIFQFIWPIRVQKLASREHITNNRFGHFRLEFVTLILIKIDEFVLLHCIQNCVLSNYPQSFIFLCNVHLTHFGTEVTANNKIGINKIKTKKEGFVVDGFRWLIFKRWKGEIILLRIKCNRKVCEVC